MSRKYREEPECNDWFSPQCSECKQLCVPTLVDLGIGPYEYWGQKGNDVSYQWLSNCCEAEIEEEGSHETKTPDPSGDALKSIGLLE